MEFVKKQNIEIQKIDSNMSLTKEEPKFLKVNEIKNLREDIMEFYKKQQNIQWTESEIDYNKSDIVNFFPELEEETQTIIRSILLFFTVADKMVLGNLESLTKIPIKSVGYFFAIQNHMEVVHDIIYEKAAKLYYNDDDKYANDMELLELILKNAEENSDEVFDLNNYHCSYYENKNDVEKLIFEAVTLKINLMNKWKNVNSLIHNLVAFFIIENVSFNALFSLIDTFREYNKGLKYIIDINEFVAKDEKIHADFGLYLYKHFVLNKLPEEEFKFVLKEITDTEILFLRKIISANKKINNRTVDDYVNFVKLYANGITKELGYSDLYTDVREVDPEFIVPQMKVKHNFFERTGTYVSKNANVSVNKIINLFGDEEDDDYENNYTEEEEIDVKSKE